MRIEIETWPGPGDRAEPDAAPPAGGRWRVLQVVLSEHDADVAQVERAAGGGRRDA